MFHGIVGADFERAGRRTHVCRARLSTRAGAKSGKKPKVENLDPTLRLDLLAASEKTKYEGNGRNIFVSQREVEIPKPLAAGYRRTRKEPRKKRINTTYRTFLRPRRFL